jgi:hypothetical protein
VSDQEIAETPTVVPSVEPIEMPFDPSATAPEQLDIQPAPPAPEPLVEIEVNEVDDDEPPRPRPHLFRCGRPGHEQRGSGEVVQINRDTGKLVARSGPICSRCHMEWLGKRFRTKDTGEEAPLPEGVEE